MGDRYFQNSYFLGKHVNINSTILYDYVDESGDALK